MKREPIDTSTTAGKARVMQLAAEGREVAYMHRLNNADWMTGAADVKWNWGITEYAIIAEPVGPDEVWVVIADSLLVAVRPNEHSADAIAEGEGGTVVRYRRVEE